MREEWNDFKTGSWTKSVDVRNFIQTNYTAYEGDDSFLAGATEATTKTYGLKLVNYFKTRKRKRWSFRCRYRNYIWNKCI